MKTRETRPISVYLLMACLLIQGLSGLAGGLGLLLDPTGDSLGIPLAWLEGSPFADYMIPGIVLFVALGVVPLVALYGLWTNATWGWIGAVFVGVALMVWLFVEILTIGYQPQPPLQLIYGILGAAILILAAAPRVRGYYSEGSPA